MSDYDTYNDDPQPAEPQDPRIPLMQQIVEMERAQSAMQREADRITKKSDALGQQLREARDRLGELMGWDRSAKAAAVDKLASYGTAR